ncbi:hypothetical protein SKAU_G00192070 [Synaphobranchus kaupii]|uniref:Uncharacterized protein n=1 Tax=Synaphobranchus kaupii TaxID=118154 RepID=A0A9Q1FE78_SYNKA|nr:hypothetical protein SKAU_G00192070 [Synaphobranchus kaupii]
MTYHETFASVGKKDKRNKKNTISVVWHEGTAGRSAAEVTSAYATALEKERDISHIIYWVDNCSAQNKNCSERYPNWQIYGWSSCDVVHVACTMHARCKLSHEEEFRELDFLQNKFQLQVPTTLRPQDKGVEEAKKRDILQKLCPLMTPTRRLFWSSRPVCNDDEE